jgi:hypothetical protein
MNPRTEDENSTKTEPEDLRAYRTGPDAPSSAPGAIRVTEEESPGQPRRVLVVANERFPGEDFAEELRGHLREDSEQVQVFVITPSLAESGIEHEMADFDGPIVEAAERLDWIIDELGEVGIEAEGQVGDGDPTVAVGDGLRVFPADEIIVVGHAEGRGRTYSEKDLWSRLRRNFVEPVTAIMVTPPASEDAPGQVVGIERKAESKHLDEDEMLLSRNFPPLRRRDVIGILSGFFGTIALGLIAVAAGINASGNISGAAAAVLLIAIGSFLINVAHIVGLVFFQSVRYDGIWERFFSRTSMIYTAVGVPVALALWLFAT